MRIVRSVSVNRFVNGRTAWLVAAGLAVAGCGGVGADPEPVALRASALTSVTISGTVTDTSGITLIGVGVKLNGSSQATTITDIRGHYSFSVNPGSYTVNAFGMCASFEPSLVNLNNVTTNTVANFVGSGNFCSQTTFSGATSGSLTISGTVTSAGHAVPGARVALNGSTQGFRFSDQNGAYSFSVNPGSFSVSVSGACNSFAPAVANLNNITTSRTQSFVGSGNCPIAPLVLCPTMDLIFLGFNEPASCDVVSSPDCGFDRSDTWASDFLFEFSNLITPDCRFGGWFSGPGALTQQQIFDYINDLVSFAMYFMGCPATGTQAGPLTFQLIPAAFAGRTFTTADVAALSALYSSAIANAIADNGSPPLTAAQTNAINTQLAFLAGRVPNLVTSSSFSASTCP